MLDPRRLQLLVQLESLGTVRAVAAAASLSPSAVSQQLAALERESGAALLERVGRTIALTPAGRDLAADAREILERIASAEERLHALRDAPAGVVRVGAFTSALRAFVIDAAAGAAADHPGLRVRLTELEPHLSVPAVVRGEVDIVVVADFGDGALPHTPQLVRTPLAHDELLAVLPPGHVARGERVRLRDLAGDAWLMDGTDLERHVTASCRQAGFEPLVASRLSTHASLLLAVAAGLGVTVLPAFAIDRTTGVRTARLADGLTRESLALTRAGATARPSVAAALDAIVAAAARAT